jgi:UDP-N-acetyl-D-glucosamine dehydrogenase
VRVVVVALGKIGLPLAAKIALAGHQVVGCDVDERVVAAINAARAPFPGEAGLAEALARLVADGRLRAVTDTRAAVAAGPELIVAVPPLGLDRDGAIDFGALDGALGQIGAGLRPGAVVSVETTLPVGTTRQRLAPALQATSGLRAERDFHLVHSPERVYSGRVLADLDAYPKLVGGLSERGEQRAIELYRAFLSAEVRGLGSAEAAELTKLAETTYRDLNIAFANELAIHCEGIGIDCRKVIDAANSQPYSHIHRPGIAVGGHCIPVYPRFYLAGDPGAQLPAVARAVNESMPAHALGRLEQALGGDLAGMRVLILGVAYRGGVKEAAFSGALALRDGLQARGATALASDPLFDRHELEGLGLRAWDGGPVDAAIVQADHHDYRSLTPERLPGARAVLDGRGVLDRQAWRGSGVALLVLGDGEPVSRESAAPRRA